MLAPLFRALRFQLRFQLREPLLDAIAPGEVLQLLQLLRVAGVCRVEPGDSRAACENAIEGRARIVYARVLRSFSTRARRIPRMRAAGQILLQLAFHFAALGQQRSDISLELARFLLLLDQGALEHGHLVVDERLTLDAGAREIVLPALQRGLDMRRELLALGIQ